MLHDKAPCRKILTALAAGLMTVLTASGAIAQNDPRFGLLEVPEGTADYWQMTLDAAGYHMVNTESSSAIRYNWVRSSEAALGTRYISTGVDILEEDPTSAAGLLYGFETGEESNRYYMFMLEPNQTATLYLRTADGVVAISSLQTSSIGDGVNTLSILEEGGQVGFFVNDEVVALIGGVRGTNEGDIGIISWGIGHYLFTGFTEESPAYGDTGKPAATK